MARYKARKVHLEEGAPKGVSSRGKIVEGRVTKPPKPKKGKDPEKAKAREAARKAKQAAKKKAKERAKMQRETATFIIQQAKHYAFKKSNGKMLHPATIQLEGGETVSYRVGGYGGYAGQDWEGRVILNEAEAHFIIDKAKKIVAEAYVNLSKGGTFYTRWEENRDGDPYAADDYIREARSRAEKFDAKLDSSVSKEGIYNIALRIEKASFDFFDIEYKYIYTYDDKDAEEAWAMIIFALDTAVSEERISGVEMKKRVRIREQEVLKGGWFEATEAKETGWIGSAER